MKHFITSLLLAMFFVARAQTVPVSGSLNVDLSNYYRKGEVYNKSQIDSLLKIKPTDPGTSNPPPNNLSDCKRGPIPSRTYEVTTTHAMVLWDGEDVYGWDYSIYRGTERVAFGSVKPVSNKEQITYAGLTPGTYTLSLSGNTCKSDVYSTALVVPEPTGGIVAPPPVINKGKREFTMNLTGYGWDASHASGINENWRKQIDAFLNMNYKGKKFSGIDGIRINVKWYEYEPVEGTFRDDIVDRAAAWCRERGLKLSFALIPWRRENLEAVPVVPDGEKAALNDRNRWIDLDEANKKGNGYRWYEEQDRLPISPDRTYTVSLNGPVARTKFWNAARRLAAALAKHDNAGYISTANAHTEEYQLMRQENPILMTGYAQADFDVWKQYSGGMPVPYPPIWSDDNNDRESAIRAMMNTDAGRKWYMFHSIGLRDFHAGFVQAVRQGGQGKVLACGMYAGIEAGSGIYNLTNYLNVLFSAGLPGQPDLIYSSEGDAHSQWRKIAATDLNLGTFPGAATAIEFDPPDVAVSQEWAPGWNEPLSSKILYENCRAFFIRGGNMVHFSMAFNPDRLNDMAEGLYKLRSEFIDSNSGMTGITQLPPITAPVTTSEWTNFTTQWRDKCGSGFDKQALILLK